ncbi:DUF3558 domain-containing protein [Nocardia sp. NPDC049707]|uniref:DUF3558 domain-containing protein n=1 Tax=Nocardia sp. NPDC049707 TaxID=3154735 RepID=UPI003420FE0A
MINRSLTAGCVLVTLGLLTACANDNANDHGSNQSSTSPASRTTSKSGEIPPAPKQPDGINPVRFDPCFTIDDAMATSAGFDPKTRTRSDLVAGDTVVIGCSFERPKNADGEVTGDVIVRSKNTPIAGAATSSHNTVISRDPIDGRPAVVFTDDAFPNFCNAAISSTDGVLEIVLSAIPGSTPASSSCDQVRGVAENFASALGDK